MKVIRMDIRKMRAAAEEATGLLRALGNSDRLLLLCQLGRGERSVSELQEELAIEQPTLSQQLAVLRSLGLVRTRRDGKRVYYSMRDPRAVELLETLYRLFCARPRAG